MSNKSRAPDADYASLEKRQKELQAVLNGMSSRFADHAQGLAVRITDQEFKSLRDFIYERSGISLPATRKYLLENRLSSRLRELRLKSFSDYIKHLKNSHGNSQEQSRLFELVTTNETSFYRNTAQLEVLQKHVLPELLKSKRATKDHKLHIWSAGCSSGEEPYTLSIILHEVLGSELSRWRVRITANDLSQAVLKAAQDGIYSDHALRTTPKEVLRAYFQKRGDRFLVCPKVKSLVRFAPLNLNDAGQIRRVERADVVFCRNVIIYFDTDMKKRVISSFEERLLPGGFLFIGHSETLHGISTSFACRFFPGAVVYQKPEGGGR